MEILVRAVNVRHDDNLHAEVESRLQASLGRLAHRIQRVTVRFVDQNGPRGGKDIACLVDVHLRPRGRLFVQETDLDLLSAVNRAGAAAATAMSRRIERSRDRRRGVSLGRILGSSGARRHADESFA